MIEIVKVQSSEVNIDKKEVLRYLGYMSGCRDEGVIRLMDEMIDEFRGVAEYKGCFDVFPVMCSDEAVADLGFTRVHSEALCKSLKDCSEIVVFTATAGAMADRLIMRLSAVHPTKAAILQAVGAAAVEGWCELLSERLYSYAFMKGRYLHPRFSPGYGDLDLLVQKDILSVLDCGRKIGVTLTESLMMTPTKSVSAIIGISDVPICRSVSKCTACGNKTCEYKTD